MDPSIVSTPDPGDFGLSSLRPQLDLHPALLAAAGDGDRAVKLVNAALEGDLRRARKQSKKLRKSGKSVGQSIAAVVGVPRSQRPVPLHLAAAKGEVAMCKFLLTTCEIDVNSTDTDGATSLIYAVQGLGSIDVINLLLSYNADPNKLDGDGIGPLHIAAERGLTTCVKNLLKADADANRPTENGELPVEIAAQGRSEEVEECVKILFPVTTPKAEYADWSAHGIIQHAKKVNDTYLGLAAEVMPCVVIIEDSKSGDYYSGSVFFKSKVDTYILTQSRDDQSDGDLVVFFHDKSSFPASILMKDESFTILKLGLVHGDCKALTFKDPTFVCTSFTLIPKDPRNNDSLSLFEKTPGFMHQAEWYSAKGDAPISTIPETKNYFINLCHHGSTSMMICCPVFKMDGDCMGLVVGDCKDVNGYDDTPHKICLKGSCVKQVIQKMFKSAVGETETLTPKKVDKRKRRSDPEQPGTSRGTRRKRSRQFRRSSHK